MNIDSNYYMTQIIQKQIYEPQSYEPQSYETPSYEPPSIVYLVYDTKKHIFKPKLRTNYLDVTDKHIVEIFSQEYSFSVLTIYSPIEEQHHVKLISIENDKIESKIYQYYDFYDISTDNIIVCQNYSTQIIDDNLYYVKMTSYRPNFKSNNLDRFTLDSFVIYEFSLSN